MCTYHVKIYAWSAIQFLPVRNEIYPSIPLDNISVSDKVLAKTY